MCGFKGVSRVFKKFQEVPGAFQGCDIVFKRVSDAFHSRGVPGRLRELHERSIQFHAIFVTFQECSWGLREFQRYSRGFSSDPDVLKGIQRLQGMPKAF